MVRVILGIAYRTPYYLSMLCNVIDSNPDKRTLYRYIYGSIMIKGDTSF